MASKILTDYYPVYKDINDIAGTYTHDGRPHPFIKNDRPDKQDTTSMEAAGPRVIPEAMELVELSVRNGFSTVQTVILLVKNAFEGHSLLSHNIRPGKLFSEGTILYKPEPIYLMVSFYENFENYRPGLIEIQKLLCSIDPLLTEKRFNFLIDSLLNNHLIRFPVSLFSSVDPVSITEDLLPGHQEAGQGFELALHGERMLGELEFIKRINLDYSDKFEESVHQLNLKGDILSHYKKKLNIALLHDINNEEELDDLMYKNLIEEKLRTNSTNGLNYYRGGSDDGQKDPDKNKLISKIRFLYRFISKNCHEVHSSPEEDNPFPELNNLFIEASKIYSQSVSNISDLYLQYITMSFLFSKLVILRKNRKLEMPENHRLISDVNGKGIMLSNENLRILRRDLETRMAEHRLNSLTDYKVKFVIDDNLKDVHKHFLEEQLNYIDQQIIKIQKDIKEVLNMKSNLQQFGINKN